jgi:hypothetical protein
MPIEGDLKSLNLSSVLQLIAQERLSGVLKVKRKNEVVDVGFADGQISGAFYERGEKVERLEVYLVRSGIIGKNVYEMVQEVHNETKRPVMNILLEDKYLTTAEVERIIKFKIQEVFDEIFTWTDGGFTFEQNSIIYPKSLIKIRMQTEGLILESARRFDEWQRIKNDIPAGDIVFRKVERPELKLKPSDEESRVLSLLNGHRSVDDLVEISGLGTFHTYSCLHRLSSTGQIEIAYAKPKATRTRSLRKSILKYVAMPLTAIIAIAILIAEVLIGQYFASQPTFTLNPIDEGFIETDYTHYQEIYFYRYNRTPSVEDIRDIFSQ